MASLMEDFMSILEEENGEYQRLTELSHEKRQIIIDGDIPALEAITDREQEVTSRLVNLENKRNEVVAAKQDTSSLEKLKEKKLEVYHKEEQKEEEMLIEEFVSFSRIASK